MNILQLIKDILLTVPNSQPGQLKAEVWVRDRKGEYSPVTGIVFDEGKLFIKSDSDET